LIRLHAEEGTSLLEIALILPVLVVLLLGIVDIGRYATLSIAVSNAARAGVQYGAQSLATASDSTGIQSAATGDANLNPQLQVSSALACYCSGSTCTGLCAAPNIEIVYLTVNTTSTFTPLFNYPGLSLATSVNGKAEMRVAQ
jgi:Flp pilus assembly protein TadG